VGNPLLENFDYSALKERKLSPKGFTLALIPGSRVQEVRKMLPFMIDCALTLKKIYENKGLSPMRIVVSKTSLSQKLYESANRFGFEFETDFDKILRNADVALVTSGTASLQVGLAAIPHIVLYKTSSLSFFIYKTIINKKELSIGLSNIVAEKQIVKEFIQNKMVVKDVVESLKEIIENAEEYNKITKNLQTLRFLFGSQKTSDEIVNLIEKILGNA
jgi:lipid-A-disaccharide synthase